VRKGKLLLLLILSTALLVLPGGLYSAFDKDEPKYLEAVREMVEMGDYITPYYNYEYRFDKPILVYWLILLGYKLFGLSEFGGRFFVSASGLLCVLLVFWWLRERGEDFAFWASVVLLSLLDFVVMSSVAMPDALLTFFTASALIFFFKGYHEGRSGFYTLSCACAGFATLAKGPVGTVLPALVALVYLLIRRDLGKVVGEFPWLKGALAYTAVVAPWYGAVLAKHGYQFFKEFILFHNIHRFTSKVPGHPTQWWYYLANYFWLYLPWSFVFPFAVFKLWKEKVFVTDDLAGYSLVWLGTVFAFFQTAHTKLAHYLLPSFPPFAVLVTMYLWKWKPGKAPVFLTAGALAVLGIAGAVYFSLSGWSRPGAVFILPAAAGALIALKENRLLKPVSMGFLASLVLFKWVTLPLLEGYRAKPALGKELRSLLSAHPHFKVVFLDYTSPEIIFYRRGKIEEVGAGRAKELLSGKDPVVVVTRENRLPRLKGASYHIWKKRKELLTRHRLVLISNLPRESVQ